MIRLASCSALERHGKPDASQPYHPHLIKQVGGESCCHARSTGALPQARLVGGANWHYGTPPQQSNDPLTRLWATFRPAATLQSQRR